MDPNFYPKLFFHTLLSINFFHCLIFLLGRPKCYVIFFLYISSFFVVYYLPDDYSVHFLFYYTFVKALYFFTDEQQLNGVDRLFYLYYESLSRLYSKRSELATIHCHSHLFSQVNHHGALCFTSCFPRESYRAYVLQLCKSKTYVLRQLITWYEIS
jgi:hypothetical protein